MSVYDAKHPFIAMPHLLASAIVVKTDGGANAADDS